MKTPPKVPYLAYMAPMGKASLLSVFWGSRHRGDPCFSSLGLTGCSLLGQSTSWGARWTRSASPLSSPLGVDSANQMAFSCLHFHNCFTSCKIDPGQHFTKTMEPPTMAESSMETGVTVLGYRASRRASRQSLYYVW